MLTEIQLAALCVAVISVGLLGAVLYSYRPKQKNRWESTLDDMINGYELKLPKEVYEYRHLRKKDPSNSKDLQAALFRRALAVIPLAQRVQSDNHGMQRLKRSDVLRDSAFQSFQYAETILEREIAEVQQEALRLRPTTNWNEQIYPQAAHLYHNMKIKEAQVEAEKKAAAAAEAEKVREEKKRQKALEDLMKDEENKKTK